MPNLFKEVLTDRKKRRLKSERASLRIYQSLNGIAVRENQKLSHERHHTYAKLDHAKGGVRKERGRVN